MTAKNRRLIIFAVIAVALILAAVLLSDEVSTLWTVYRSAGSPAGGSPVGEWEQPDGVSIQFNDNGAFIALTSTGRIIGRWEQSGGRLCLAPSGGGDEECYDYTQRGDMLTLDEAIYIRQ